MKDIVSESFSSIIIYSTFINTHGMPGVTLISACTKITTELCLGREEAVMERRDDRPEGA